MSELASVWNSRRVRGVTLMLFIDAVHETQDSNHIIMKDAGMVGECAQSEWSGLTDEQRIELVCECGEKVGDFAEALILWRR